MSRTVVLVLVILAFCECRYIEKLTPNDIWGDPDIFRNVSTLISSKGYPVEEHIVETTDGYLLTAIRIPHGRNNHFMGGKRPAIYLQHGLLGASSDWVLNLPEQSLGFILADAGYDVWLGNTRGNVYSRHHKKYSPSHREFWDYCFDDMAKYDLPAMIDYILNVTEEDDLYYIGHSQGTTSAFALLSESPEYNKKIKLFIALAPVATVGFITCPIKYLAPFTNDLYFLAKLIGLNEFLPSSVIMKWLGEFVCESKEQVLCENIFFLIFGYDKPELNASRIGVYAAHFPSGSSAKSIVHYAQMVNSMLFTKYDYGAKENVKRYNQTTAPEYDLSRITAPVALIWSMNDQLGDPVDVAMLQPKLKSLVSSYCVSAPLFGHVDYVIAVHAKKLVYDQIFTLLAQY